MTVKKLKVNHSADHNIIDCHIHPSLDEATILGRYYPTCDMQRQIDTLRRAGISRACGSPIRYFQPASFDGIKALNDKALALRDRFPGFYIPGIQVHPHFPDESCREIERCCGREGVRWIGELVGSPTGYGEEFATDTALVIMRTAVKHNATVNFHCHDLDVVDRLCKAVPDLNLVLAHPEEGDDFLNRLAKVAAFPNLHLDISGTGIDRYGSLRKAVEIVGKEKILFGSDYPVNNPAVYVQGALFEALTAEQYAAIFENNFLRLISSDA